MDRQRITLLTRSRSNIKFLTSMFFVTLNNMSLNKVISSMLFGEFLIIEILGVSYRDVIGWHDS